MVLELEKYVTFIEAIFLASLDLTSSLTVAINESLQLDT
jgi:hypothetical protein